MRDLIVQRYRIRLSVWTEDRYLRRWGLTPQKPLGQAYERDPVAVRRWLLQQYLAIRVLARQEQATIFWGDETAMRSDHQAGRKVFLVMDEHPVHMSAVVAGWVEHDRQHLRLLFLPGYSPGPNPDEFLNRMSRPTQSDGSALRIKIELLDNMRRYP